ncbi:hypothetical protein PPROV_000816900 [Pycnococcus provasolii]|uniref:Uncharacterized protein n=1 Tax=Pycnococcus provasolii TaxID=41880 RepID=A0A830HQL2_9CHLO|nr:hypothetical protein PPROV_000816900 [Pycnococcus provasolii]
MAASPLAMLREHWPKLAATAILILFGVLALQHQRESAKQSETSMSKIIHDYDSKECARLLEEQQSQDDQILAAQRANLEEEKRRAAEAATDARYAHNKKHDATQRMDRLRNELAAKDKQIRSLQERLSQCIVDNKSLREKAEGAVGLQDELMRKVQDQDEKLSQVEGITDTFKFLSDEYKESKTREVSGEGPYRNNTDSNERARASKFDAVKRTEEASAESRAQADQEAKELEAVRAAGGMANAEQAGR